MYTTIVDNVWFSAVPEDSTDSLSIENAREIRRNFSIALRNYIRGNALKITILKQMTVILVSIYLFVGIKKSTIIQIFLEYYLGRR